MKITISTAQGTQTTYEYEQLAQMWKDGMLKAETLIIAFSMITNLQYEFI